MSNMVQLSESAGRRFAAIRPYLDERQRRLWLGVEAGELGRGGIKAIAVATGVRPDTVARGFHEMEGVPALTRRVRAPGGGRKSLAESDPAILVELSTLVETGKRGRSDVAAGLDDEIDPESG